MKDNLSLVHFAHHDLQDVGVGVHHDRIGCTWARALLPAQALASLGWRRMLPESWTNRRWSVISMTPLQM